MSDKPLPIVAPILVVDRDDLSFFESEDAVGFHLEPWYPDE